MNYQLIQSPWLKKILPVTLAATAGAGVIGTAVLTAKATPEALERKAEAEKAKGEPLTTWETVQAMAPSYIPAAGAGIATIASIAGMALVNKNQQAKLAGVIAGGNQIINRVSKKYDALRNEVRENDPELLKRFDVKSLEDEWEPYVKERRKKKAFCPLECLDMDDPHEWGVPRMWFIEYGHGLEDENGHEGVMFEATPGDVLSALYQLQKKFDDMGYAYFNDLLTFLHLPHTDLGSKLIWEIDAVFNDWETGWLDTYTSTTPLEDDVPEPIVCTELFFYSPPMAEGYAEWAEIPSRLHPQDG